MVMEFEDLPPHYQRIVKNSLVFEVWKCFLSGTTCFFCEYLGCFCCLCPIFWTCEGVCCFLPLLVLNVCILILCLPFLIGLLFFVLVTGLMTFGLGFVLLSPLLLIPILSIIFIGFISLPTFLGPVTGIVCYPCGCLFGFLCELIPNIAIPLTYFFDKPSFNHLNITFENDEMRRSLIGSIQHEEEEEEEETEKSLKRGFSFLVESDLHFKEDITETKKESVQKIITCCHDDPNCVALIIPGDLTDKGFDGKAILGFNYGGTVDQFSNFMNKYVEPIEKTTNLRLYFGFGNHDQYVPFPYFHKPVRNFVCLRHGSIRYSFDIGDVHFISLGRYPDEKSIKFLKKDLEVLEPDDIIVIFFHFNMSGKWSNWWKDEEKETFYEHIKDRNVAGLLVGHSHCSKVSSWKGIKVISGAHTKIPKVTFSPGVHWRKCLKVKFI